LVVALSEICGAVLRDLVPVVLLDDAGNGTRWIEATRVLARCERAVHLGGWPLIAMGFEPDSLTISETAGGAQLWSRIARLGRRNLLTRKPANPTRSRSFDFLDEYPGTEISREVHTCIRA